MKKEPKKEMQNANEVLEKEKKKFHVTSEGKYLEVKDKWEVEYTPDELKAEEQEIQKLVSKCQLRVFKDYLGYISTEYECSNITENWIKNPQGKVALFKITKYVTDEKEKNIDRLKNVFHVLANTTDTLALIIHRSASQCELFLATGTLPQYNSEGEEDNSPQFAKESAKRVRDSFLGNFPGSSCGEIKILDENESGTGLLKNSEGCSIGIVSNIATEYSEDFLAQGIEKLLDGIIPEEGKQYTLVILAEALNGSAIYEKKRVLNNIYTALSPYSSVQKNWSVGEARDWSSQWHADVHVDAKVGTNLPFVDGEVGVGVGAGYSHTWGGSVNANNGGSTSVIDYSVKHSMDIIEKQMERLEECTALGVWDIATYVISPDRDTATEVAQMYMSLTEGKDSFYERPSINVWDGNLGENKATIENITTFLRALRHPVFAIKRKEENEIWPKSIKATTTISGAELARAMNLPTKSVPGLAVIKCAAFGREIASYNELNKGEIELGCIHHMHMDENNSRVALAKKSLTSHVFVTGSTGAGKSNTVYKLLSEAMEVDAHFMVIEPAKGEYKYAFGDEVQVYGSNPKVGKLLKLNPFVFPSDIHVFEHIDRILEVFNVCWPMYAAMPAILKQAIIDAYEESGWDLRKSECTKGNIYPTFDDVLRHIDRIADSSDYSDENKSNYKGALKTRVQSLTNGINGMIFCDGNLSDKELFDENVIVDLSRIGSNETKSLLMGILVIKLQEYRMCSGVINSDLRHITVLEEAHNLLRGNAHSGSDEGGNIAGKSVEMIANAIAEMRTYGESFVIVDQSPGLMDMSAIRNTNTKIIMRLPDQTDRELVGRAVGLNDSQIAELAKLQQGVAAVYQNEWIEAVLCRVDKYDVKTISRETEIAKGSEENDNSKEEAMDYLTLCVYEPEYMRASDLNFIDYVEKAPLNGYVKSALIDYYRTPEEEKFEIWEKAMQRFFEVEKMGVRLKEKYTEDIYAEPHKWMEIVMQDINENYKLFHLRDFKKNADVQYRFIVTFAEAWINIMQDKTEFQNDVEGINRCIEELIRERTDGTWKF